MSKGTVPNHNKIDKFPAIVLDAGALFTKLAGAGGGGSISGLVPPEKRAKMMEILSVQGCFEEPGIRVETEGSRVVYNYGSHRLRR